MTPQKVLTVVLIDEDDDDVFLMKRALARLDSTAQVTIEVVSIHSGLSALSDLKTLLARGIRPYCVCVDTDVEAADSINLLSAIKCQGETRDLPLVVLTSGQEREHQVARALGADHVFTKPAGVRELEKLFQTILAGGTKLGT
ncbi:response regulator [Roseibium hamelinense]|nr:response regulator [Roseibium hamelinense]MTI44296.1 response regulator [Roseibium hamelinense]